MSKYCSLQLPAALPAPVLPFFMSQPDYLFSKMQIWSYFLYSVSQPNRAMCDPLHGCPSCATFTQGISPWSCICQRHFSIFLPPPCFSQYWSHIDPILYWYWWHLLLTPAPSCLSPTAMSLLLHWARGPSAMLPQEDQTLILKPPVYLKISHTKL